jgi:uncharacterized protein YndB with AHSA1/START domain
MKPITRQTLEWIPSAPVRITRTRRMAAPPERVWSAIADHESWSDWFPALTAVEELDPGEGVGGRRRVHIGRLSVEEEFLVWEPDTRFAFTVTHADRRGIRSMVEDVRLTSVAGAATEVEYTQAVEPLGSRLLAPVVARLMSRQLERGLAGLAAHVEGAQPGLGATG